MFIALTRDSSIKKATGHIFLTKVICTTYDIILVQPFMSKYSQNQLRSLKRA